MYIMKGLLLVGEFYTTHTESDYWRKKKEKEKKMEDLLINLLIKNLLLKKYLRKQNLLIFAKKKIN